MGDICSQISRVPPSFWQGAPHRGQPTYFTSAGPVTLLSCPSLASAATRNQIKKKSTVSAVGKNAKKRRLARKGRRAQGQGELGAAAPNSLMQVKTLRSVQQANMRSPVPPPNWSDEMTLLAVGPPPHLHLPFSRRNPLAGVRAARRFLPAAACARRRFRGLSLAVAFSPPLVHGRRSCSAREL